MTVLIGIKIGDRRQPSAICVIEEERRADDGQYHFMARHLQRLPPGTSLPAVASRVGEVEERIRKRGGSGSKIYIDATGRGQPIIDLIKRYVGSPTVVPVFFNHGDRRTEEGDSVNLGKAYLVARLQLLLQDGRLHLPRTPDAEQLAEDLLQYEVKVEPDANERYGAFSVGVHDDLVMALGLAVQGGKRIYSAVLRG